MTPILWGDGAFGVPVSDCRYSSETSYDAKQRIEQVCLPAKPQRRRDNRIDGARRRGGCAWSS